MCIQFSDKVTTKIEFNGRDMRMETFDTVRESAIDFVEVKESM